MISFEVRVGDDFRKAELQFGAESDVRQISNWRVPRHSTAAVRDALEFARLASKRWRYYRRSIESISTIGDFKRVTRGNPRAEISFILLARADWFSRTVPMGLAQCRRTYCNNIVLEFLAVHPRALAGVGGQVRGVGTGLVYSLAFLARALEVPLIWGEATEFSAPFYQHVFGLPIVSDHFFVDEDALKIGADRFANDIAGQADWLD